MHFLYLIYYELAASTLLAHLQEALHEQLVYCVRVMSVGCYQGWIGIPVATDRHNTHAVNQVFNPYTVNFFLCTISQ
jgi:hypothetical protein